MLAHNNRPTDPKICTRTAAGTTGTASSAAGLSDASSLRVDALRHITHGCHVTAERRVGRVLAGGLLSASVHTEVDDSQGAVLAEHPRICVDHLHHIGIHVPQSVGAPHKRARRIQTYDPVHPEQQCERQQSTHVRPKAVANACCFVHLDSTAPQECKQLRDTPCHRFHVVHGCCIARWTAEGAPVDGEHVVCAIGQVRVPQNDHGKRAVLPTVPMDEHDSVMVTIPAIGPQPISCRQVHRLPDGRLRARVEVEPDVWIGARVPASPAAPDAILSRRICHVAQKQRLRNRPLSQTT